MVLDTRTPVGKQSCPKPIHHHPTGSHALGRYVSLPKLLSHASCQVVQHHSQLCKDYESLNANLRLVLLTRAFKQNSDP